jgi:hypothetical protein
MSRIIIAVLKNNFALVAAGFSLRPGKFSLYEKTYENHYIYSSGCRPEQPLPEYKDTP